VLRRLAHSRGKENSASRAYVDLPDEAACVAFAKAYNGHVFENKQGQRSQALVDYAPFPKVPTPAARRKPDPRQGSIEEGGRVASRSDICVTGAHRQ
jgi:regulator of nonsense transcripts 3